MGILNLNWDATNTDGNPTVTGQRISKRIKAIGGAWDTSGFDTSNDMTNSQDNNQALGLTNNRVYEFKLESLCSEGGPVLVSNGIQEGIFMSCILPSITRTHNSAAVAVNLSGTDITKMKVVLKKTSDDSVIDTKTSVNVGLTTAYFTGLLAVTEYYVTIEFYANVNGIEVISSGPDFLNSVCGGSAEYEFETSAAPDSINISGGLGNSLSGVCADTRVLYIPDSLDDIESGVTVYADAGLTTPYTGFTYVRGQDGKIYTISNTTGLVGAFTGNYCGGTFEVFNDAPAGNTINTIIPGFFSLLTGSIPTASGSSATGKHGSLNSIVTVNITADEGCTVTGYVNGSPVDNASVGAGTANFDLTMAFDAGDNVVIRLEAAI